MAFFLLSSVALAQGQRVEEKQGIYAMVKDGRGETVEGFLHLTPMNRGALERKPGENHPGKIHQIYYPGKDQR